MDTAKIWQGEKIKLKLLNVVLIIALLGMFAVFAVQAEGGEPSLTLLAAGLEGALGSTVGPDGALYLTEGAAGRVSRVDPQTGNITTFARGLPHS